jgi:hypothetical protein
MKIFQLNLYSKSILIFIFILGIIISYRQIFYPILKLKIINYIGPIIMILVILYLIITSIVNKISLKKTIKEIIKTIFISFTLIFTLFIIYYGILYLIFSKNLMIQLISIIILIFIIANIIFIFNVNKINPKEKRNLIKKILKFLNIAIIIIVTLIIVSLIFYGFVIEPLKPRRNDRLPYPVTFENIPDPTTIKPISFENNRIYIESGKEKMIRFKALNPLLENANLSISSSYCHEIIENDKIRENINESSVIISNIKPNTVIEYALLFKPKSSAGEIKLCDLTFKFDGINGKNSIIKNTVSLIIE